MFRKITGSVFLLILLISNIGFTSDNIHSERKERHDSRIYFPVSNQLPEFYGPISAAKLSDFDDLKVSETVAPATFEQRYNSSASLGDGGYVIVWQDNRDGYFNIYGQKFDSNGDPVGSNVKLVGRADGYNSIEPKAVAYSAGGFFLGWRDQATGLIYVAVYDNNLSQTLSPFTVNDIPSGNFSGPFDIDVYGTQYLAVVYEDHGLTTDISLRIFTPGGLALTSPITINTDGGGAEHWSPSIAFGNLGGMAVVWEDYRNGNADIFFQLVNANGSLSGSNIGIIQALYDDSAQYSPEIAYSSRDGYAIAWLDNRGEKQNVYMQRYIPASGLSGGNVQISGDDPDYADWGIGLAVNSNNDLAMVWSSSNSEGNIIMQRFSTGFTQLSARDSVSCCMAAIQKTEPSIAYDIANKIIIAWTDQRNNHRDIYSQYLSSSAVSLYGDDAKVNDDSEGANSYDPNIVIIDATQSAIVFTDERNDDGDIYLQLLSSTGSLNGNNILVNSDNSGVLQNEPSLAVSSSTIFTTWNDNRSVIGVTGQRIFAEYYNHSGTVTTDEFVVSDSDNVNIKSQPSGALSSDNSALVVWQELPMANLEVMGRFLNPDGSFKSVIFELSNDADDLGNDDINVIVSSGDNFIVGWIARGASGGSKAVVARYNSSGTLLNRFTYSSPVGGVYIDDISLAVDNTEQVYIFWQGTDSRLYFSRLSSTGVVDIDGSVIDSDQYSDYDPMITVDGDGNMALCYKKEILTYRRLYYLVYNTSLNAFSKDFVVSSLVPAIGSGAVDVIDNELHFVWSDARSEGLNIYTKSISYSPTDVDYIETIIPNGYVLEQNYPNPFNPVTSIKFSLPGSADVNLSVYNILGERVTTLLDNSMPAGTHTIRWEGTDDGGNRVGSGIYFYRIDSGDFNQTRKMILLK